MSIDECAGGEQEGTQTVHSGLDKADGVIEVTTEGRDGTSKIDILSNIALDVPGSESSVDPSGSARVETTHAPR